MGQQTPRHTSGTNKQPKRGMHECVWVRPVASDGREGALNTRGRTAAGQKAQAGLIARAHKSDTRVAWQGGGRIEGRWHNGSGKDRPRESRKGTEQ